MNGPKLNWIAVVLTGCLFLGGPAFRCRSARAADQKLNVLLITVDDMNCDSIGAFGCKVDDITPNIDRLASQGMRFKHGHVTIAMCQPTRAVWMTGRYPHRNGALGFDPINPGVPTLLETLKDAGYLTGILAKVPHVVPTRKHAWDMIVRANHLKTGRDPKRYYEHCRAFFQKAKATKKPFFLMANAQDPHRPFAGSADEKARIARDKVKSKRKGTDRPDGFPAVTRTYRPEEITVAGYLPDIADVRQELAEYFTTVHRADEIVGSVLRALDEAGFADNTLVMFASDHGAALPFAKMNCWLHSTRTPWIVRWPEIVKPGSFDQAHFISGIDLAPTILNAVDLPPLPEVDGRSFVPLLKGQSQPDRDRVFTEFNHTIVGDKYPMRAVHTEKFSYILNAWPDGRTLFKGDSQAGLTMDAMVRASRSDPRIAARARHYLYRTPQEFYDCENDPDALHNLIDDPRYQDEIKRIRRVLLEHLKDTGDPQASDFSRLVFSM